MKLTPGNRTLASQIQDWYALDIGFSSSKQSSGVYRTDKEEPQLKFYGELFEDIIDFVKKSTRAGLIIEAPLSCSFNSKGNPCGRSFEKQRTKTRYWFAGLGCAVMSAALFLLHKLHGDPDASEIVLFEGFISFKENPTRHEHDALTLYENRKNVIDANQICSASGGKLVGLTSLFGGMSEAPGVIICRG